jgi:dihydroneopterin aldolase
MSDTIFINGLVLHAYHGVMAHEGKVGQPFILDLVLHIDLAQAAKSDKVADTISYDQVVGTASEAFKARRYKLIEAAGAAVADAVLAAYPKVTQVQVTVRKPHAPVAAVFDDVGVTLTRARRG